MEKHWTDDAPAGWRFTIAVPQPNGSVNQHVWVLAISDEEEAKEKLQIAENPCEFESLPLSQADLIELGLEAGEIARLR